MSALESALIVEDDPIIAFALEDMLLDIGFAEVQLATTLDEARKRLENATPSVAVLDVNIHGQRSYALAPMLQDRKVPIVFATGYGDAEHPDQLKSAPTVTKPYSLADIHGAIRRAMGCA